MLFEDVHQWIQSDEQESFGKKSGKKKSRRSSAASVIHLQLMMEVTNPGPLSAPVLTRTAQKSPLPVGDSSHGLCCLYELRRHGQRCLREPCGSAHSPAV
ncbi:unnamed protein product [Pleuronectes platessa]|uniref:UFSP2 second domain-containing protein n=1 Tax=Pleuronectes platessa TaxID=8262 RepID=A0A9N7YM98_PLEPL|nr:unnamed protein product [Pleuronectes platessa]